MITGLWRTLPGDTFDFEGAHYQLRDSPALPKPVQRPHPPVIMGGTGPRRTPALAARYAAEFNVAFRPIDVVGAPVRPGAARPARRSGAIRRSCGSRWRRPSASGGTTPRWRDGRWRSAATSTTCAPTGWPAPPREVVDRIGEWRERTGISRLHLQLLDLADLDHIELIAEQVRV